MAATTNKRASSSEVDNMEETTTKKYKTAQTTEVDLSQYIPVINGFQGPLTYKSARTGEITHWDSFGSEQDIELRELKSAKTAHKNFFINNWFLFDDEYAWVIDYLGVGRYYENALSYNNFDDIFKKKASEVKKIVSNLSAGQKKSVIYRAKELIASGEIDSISVVNALEEALGVELIER